MYFKKTIVCNLISQKALGIDTLGLNTFLHIKTYEILVIILSIVFLYKMFSTRPVRSLNIGRTLSVIYSRYQLLILLYLVSRPYKRLHYGLECGLKWKSILSSGMSNKEKGYMLLAMLSISN